MNRTALRQGFHLSAGPLAGRISAEVSRAADIAAGLFRRDPSVWSADAGVQQKIANRLGWLASPRLMADSIKRLSHAAEEVQREGVTDVVLLGMGGSSLAPEVLRAIVGVQTGWPRLHMLDSTDPASVRAITAEPAKTLYILASKSGTTIEPNSLAAYFRRALDTSHVPRASHHFIAITDPGTELDTRARTEHFRDVFINPADIGGRYSALSFFGLLPSALMGQDVSAIINWGLAMLEEAQTAADVASNPAVALGLLMAAGAQEGRDKLTLITPPLFEPFGLWVEQLVAESTGKQGIGIVPIAGEPLGEKQVYGDDRVFVRLRLSGDPDEERRDRAMQHLGLAPVLTLDVPETAALGAEFVRWEIATALAGGLLGINPFDEPNVQQAKDATRALLDKYTANGQLPVAPPDATLASGAALTLSSAARKKLNGADPASFLQVLAPNDYMGLLAYLGPDADLRDALQHFRISVRDRSAVATMSGYGPRYLHSTGQLHKGGPNTGVFVLVTAKPIVDAEVPGQPFSFATLEYAQALGDFASLEATGRRAIHLHLPRPDARMLGDSLGALLAHVPRRSTH